MKRRIALRLSACLGVIACSMLGTAAGLAADPISAPHVLNDTWLVDIRTVCAVGGVVLPATFVLAVFSTRITSRLKAGDERFKAIEEAIKAMQISLRNMPCQAASRLCNDPQQQQRQGKR